MDGIPFTIPFAVVVAAVFIGGFFVVNRGVKRKFLEIAPLVNGRVETSVFGTPRVQGIYGDTPFGIRYERGSRSSPAKVVVELHRGVPFKLLLRKESLDTRLSKKLGLLKEMQLGIPDFDESVFIQTDDAARTQAFLGDHGTREVIKEIHDRGCSLGFTAERIQLTRPLRAKSGIVFLSYNLIGAQEVVELLGKLHLLAGRLDSPLDRREQTV
jgi:hypothetical protein